MPYADEPPAEMADADIAAEVGRLQTIADDADAPEDDLTESGYLRLYALQTEQEWRSNRRTCPCCTRPAPGLAPGTICTTCAGWPLD